MFNAKKARENYNSNKEKDIEWLKEALLQIEEASKRGVRSINLHIGNFKTSELTSHYESKRLLLDNLGFYTFVNFNSNFLDSFTGHADIYIKVSW